MTFGLGFFPKRFVLGSSQILSWFSSSCRPILIPKTQRFIYQLDSTFRWNLANHLQKGIITWGHVPSSNTKILTSISMTKPNVVFVLGGPGAGKGTQCSKIVDNFGFVHLSAGDLLREERNNPRSQYGELIEKHIRDGTIVPVEITCSLIERAMNQSDSSNFLIDGFPRNKNNLDGWDKEMTAKVNILFVLFFDAPDDVCVDRCLSRGEAGSGRSDDNPESLKKRVFTFMNDTLPIINHFVELNLVRKIDASKSAEEVFKDVKVLFEQVMKE